MESRRTAPAQHPNTDRRPFRTGVSSGTRAYARRASQLRLNYGRFIERRTLMRPERFPGSYTGSVRPSRTKRIRRALREVVKAIAGVAAVGWLLAPITPWNGFAAFPTSSVVMLGCVLAWGLLDD
jgi:hypothetical protein